ncbi:MAG: hypothetical protein M3Y74_14465 [Chloroflexota bacterium]|nr:hypothetical protein [Chloroflexota bacterium]
MRSKSISWSSSSLSSRESVPAAFLSSNARTRAIVVSDNWNAAISSTEGARAKNAAISSVGRTSDAWLIIILLAQTGATQAWTQ